MSKIYIFPTLFLIVNLFCGVVAAQKKDAVAIVSKVSAAAGNECKDVKLGRAAKFPKPVYPAEAKAARVGGTVLIAVKIDDKGKVSEAETISGHRLLRNAATDAVGKIKFTPTICDGAAIASSAVLTYHFVPFVAAESYFTPAKIEEFADLKTDSPYYEAVLNLVQNYNFAFGYADKKFYADAPLVRGDFARYLRLTLDLLSTQAAANNKIPREINLFYPHNSQKLISVSSIKDLKPAAPYYESVKILLLKYDIALTDDNSNFQGSRYLTNNEVIDWWSKIFGEEAIPVNFGKTADGDRIISRGEFALFLQESLQVLTYKVLP